MNARRAAVIDVGTNSVLLTVARHGARHGPRHGPGDEVARESPADEPEGPRYVAELERATITRLGEGVDRTRRLSSAAMERTLGCLRDYAALIRTHAVERVALVGTSALRDAEGGDTFVRQASEIVGVPLEVISGEREAELTFRGALSDLEVGDLEVGGRAVGGPVVVVDIGGGSTEIIAGSVQRRPLVLRSSGVRSYDVGSVRLTERHVRSDPPRAEEIEAIRADVRAAWGGGDVPVPGPGVPTLVGVAGTVTTLAALALGLEHYVPEKVHGAVLDAAAVDRLVERLAALPLEERRRLPGLEPRRADVIVAGAVLCSEALRQFGGSELVVSDRGVRWGLLEELLDPAP